MRSFITNHIFPEEVKNDILRVEGIGDESYKTRLRKTIYKLSTINKTNLKLARENQKKRTQRNDQTLVELKGHQDLFGRCAIITNSSRDLEIKDMIGDHELDTVPKSLTTSDGALHPAHNNKHQLVEKLTDIYPRHTAVDEIVAFYKTIVIDAMVVVQRIANNKK